MSSDLVDEKSKLTAFSPIQHLRHLTIYSRAFFVHVAQHFLPFGMQRADFALYRRQAPTKNRCHSGQIVRRKSEDRLRLDLGQSDKTSIVQAPKQSLSKEEKAVGSEGAMLPMFAGPCWPVLILARRTTGNPAAQPACRC